MKPAETVKAFLEIVRSGKSPERAIEFMADTVLAHQLNAEGQETVTRTPLNYSGHVHDFLRQYGNYDFKITELFAQDDKVYARWEQTGKHMDTVDQYAPTHQLLTEIGSAVYRVVNGKITEYWIQLDREGLHKQLEQNKRNSAAPLSGRRPFTEAVGAGTLLYISGQIGSDPASGTLVNSSFRSEADQVMKNIGHILQRHNLKYSDLINVTIYLTDMANYGETNAVYSQYFEAAFPARVCIAVKELPMKANIEISAVALLRSNQD